jgi:hypothetical protein
MNWYSCAVASIGKARRCICGAARRIRSWNFTTAYDKTQAIGLLDELKTAGIMMHATPDEPAVRGDLAVAIERLLER